MQNENEQIRIFIRLPYTKALPDKLRLDKSFLTRACQRRGNFRGEMNALDAARGT